MSDISQRHLKLSALYFSLFPTKSEILNLPLSLFCNGTEEVLSENLTRPSEEHTCNYTVCLFLLWFHILFRSILFTVVQYAIVWWSGTVTVPFPSEAAPKREALSHSILIRSHDHFPSGSNFYCFRSFANFWLTGPPEPLYPSPTSYSSPWR